MPLDPPAEAAPPPPQPLKLTQKELKKLRTQRRLAREKEKQELVRQGRVRTREAWGGGWGAGRRVAGMELAHEDGGGGV